MQRGTELGASRRRRRHLVRPGVLLPGILLTLYLPLIVFGHLGDRCILATNHTGVDPHGAARKVIDVGGKAVELWVARSPAANESPRAFVLMFMGQGDRADRWAESAAAGWGGKPIELWAMNAPGAGGSEGPARLSRLGTSALAAFDAIQRAAGHRPVLVTAESLGTAPALCVAARRPVAGLILRNPLPMRQLVLGRHGWWNLWLLAIPTAWQLPHDLDAVENAAHADAPVIFLRSERDEVIPPDYQQLVVDAYRGPKREIPIAGAGHASPLTPDARRQFEEHRDALWEAAVR